MTCGTSTRGMIALGVAPVGSLGVVVSIWSMLFVEEQ